MLLEQHPVALRAMQSNRVQPVGGFISDLLFPIPSAFMSSLDTSDVGNTVTAPGTGQPVKQTFAGAFGGALGETTGKFLVAALIFGGVIWYFNRHRPRVPPVI